MSAPIRLHECQQGLPRRPRYAICTLGCKLSLADEISLPRDLRAAGLTEVPFSDESDTYIVNTCTVTHLADRGSRQMLRRATRKNQQAIVAAIRAYLPALPLLLTNQVVPVRLNEPFLDGVRAEINWTAI